ncbi:MAG TPA: LacI family DNA-binding transcriptional regulator [Rectinemataceae bacterium]|nr:LacI family DNA-binding transcriptional regulator [Rectinemataceae bacterium]
MRAFLMNQQPVRRKATVEDVVRLSGVSRSSVFRYLGGKSLRPALMAAIETAMHRLGYPVVGAPESRSFELVISTSPSFGSFRGYAEVVEGIVARAVEAGIRVSLGHSPGTEESQGSSPTDTAKPRGVIILGKSISEEQKEAEELQIHGLPFVLVNRIMEDPRSSYVSADFRLAAKEATMHLFSLGRKRIALWDDGSKVSRVQRDKLAGYVSAFEEAGIPLPGDLLTSRESGELEDEASRILSSSRRPDAWFAMDDRAAMRVIRTARDLGLRVPEDLAVIGMNDIETASISRPSLSSVRIPFFEAGWTAVDVLARLIERPVEQSIRILLGHSLIARESTLGRTKRSAS